MFPDHLVLQRRAPPGRALDGCWPTSGPGVTEVLVHPAVDTPELRAFAPDWANRVDDHALVTDADDLPAMLADAGVQLIGYEPLRDLQRAGA